MIPQMTEDEILDIVQKKKDGLPIECIHRSLLNDTYGRIVGSPSWNFDVFRYRVAQPKEKPFPRFFTHAAKRHLCDAQAYIRFDSATHRVCVMDNGSDESRGSLIDFNCISAEVAAGKWIELKDLAEAESCRNPPFPRYVGRTEKCLPWRHTCFCVHASGTEAGITADGMEEPYSVQNGDAHIRVMIAKGYWKWLTHAEAEALQTKKPKPEPATVVLKTPLVGSHPTSKFAWFKKSTGGSILAQECFLGTRPYWVQVPEKGLCTLK